MFLNQTMITSVFSGCLKNIQILWFVILFIPINVVYYLFWFEISSNYLFTHISVFCVILLSGIWMMRHIKINITSILFSTPFPAWALISNYSLSEFKFTLIGTKKAFFVHYVPLVYIYLLFTLFTKQKFPKLKLSTTDRCTKESLTDLIGRNSKFLLTIFTVSKVLRDRFYMTLRRTKSSIIHTGLYNIKGFITTLTSKITTLCFCTPYRTIRSTTLLNARWVCEESFPTMFTFFNHKSKIPASRTITAFSPQGITV